MKKIELFGIIDVEQYKDKLGRFYSPMSKLVSAVLFVLIASAIVGVAILPYAPNFKVALLIQVAVLLAYYMLLATKQEIERFSFAFISYVILTAGAPAILLEMNLAEIFNSNVDTLGDVPLPRFEIFFFALTRGIGITAWSLPVLLFFTRFPSIIKLEESLVRKRATIMVAVGLLLQATTCMLTFWLGKLRLRGFWSTEGAPEHITRVIERAQMGYFLSTLSLFMVGFIALFYFLRTRGKPKGDSWFAITLVAIVVVQVLYAVASVNLSTVNKYFPAANGRVEAWSDMANEELVFLYPIFEDLGADSLQNYVVLKICANPESNEFSSQVLHRDQLLERFKKTNILKVRMEGAPGLFCQ